MPTYRYRCDKDGEEFEVWQSIHDDTLTEHPGCGGRVTKVMAPAGIVLKGSGFYRTDSRAGSRKSGSGESGDAKDKQPAKERAGSGNGSGDAKSSSGSKDSKESSGSSGSKGDAKGSKESKPSKSGPSST
jgi:putative FmdB family regulatory protein